MNAPGSFQRHIMSTTIFVEIDKLRPTGLYIILFVQALEWVHELVSSN